MYLQQFAMCLPLQLYKSGHFSDITLTSPSNRYHVHKLILSYASEYFEKKLDELPERQNELQLEGPFTHDFDLVLK